MSSSNQGAEQVIDNPRQERTREFFSKVLHNCSLARIVCDVQSWWLLLPTTDMNNTYSAMRHTDLNCARHVLVLSITFVLSISEPIFWAHARL